MQQMFVTKSKVPVDVVHLRPKQPQQQQQQKSPGLCYNRRRGGAVAAASGQVLDKPQVSR